MAGVEQKKPVFLRAFQLLDKEFVRMDRMKRVWTAWMEYGATGEGQTLQTWIGYASDANDAKASFGGRSNSFFEQFCEVAEGVTRNRIVEALVAASTLNLLESSSGTIDIELFASLHINSA